QIGQITGQIEQLKGQIKYLDDNTSYSSVSVTLTEAGAPAQAATNDSWGFATALNDAAHNFVATINYVITAFGAIGPLVVLARLGFLLWRRRRTTPPVARHAEPDQSPPSRARSRGVHPVVNVARVIWRATASA